MPCPLVPAAGFEKDKFLLLVQPRLPLHIWNPSSKMWVQNPDAPGRTYGTGYAIKQMALFGEVTGASASRTFCRLLATQRDSQPALSDACACGVGLLCGSARGSGTEPESPIRDRTRIPHQGPNPNPPRASE